jgi:hypothetical protein
VARLRDFFAPDTHWQRRLWNLGLVLRLRELIEASEAVRARALSQESLSWFADRVRRHVPLDPGAGSQQQRTALMECLKGDLAAESVPFLMLKQYLADIEANYLQRWADALANASPPGKERAARAIAAHLLDAGFGLAHLSQWLDELLLAEPETTAVEITAAAQVLLASPQKKFEALLLFDVEPSRRATRPTEWIGSRDAAEWLRGNGFGNVKVRQRGGLRLEVEAVDRDAALQATADIADRFTARVAVGTSSTFSFHPDVFLAGIGSFSRVRPRRRVRVHALARADRVYELGVPGPIDSALELMSHLDVGPPAVAVAAGWSAVEALLTGPGDKTNVVAADRLAALVACSWARAELTDLAWARIRQQDDSLSRELAALSTNREKAARIATEIASGAHLDLNDSDAAAARRVGDALHDPRRVLTDIRAHATDAFRRLYRVRNVVLHSARTESVALSSTLRTVPPLAGAGMDRVAHAYLVSELRPLELVARAEVELARSGAVSAPKLTDLLE